MRGCLCVEGRRWTRLRAFGRVARAAARQAFSMFLLPFQGGASPQSCWRRLALAREGSHEAVARKWLLGSWGVVEGAGPMQSLGTSLGRGTLPESSAVPTLRARVAEVLVGWEHFGS